MCCTLRSPTLAAACCRSSCSSSCPCEGADKVSEVEAAQAAVEFTQGLIKDPVDYQSPTARKLLGGGKSKPFAWNPGVDVSKIGNTCLALTDQNLYTAFDCDTAETVQEKF